MIDEWSVFSIFDDRIESNTKLRVAKQILQGYEEDINEEVEEYENVKNK